MTNTTDALAFLLTIMGIAIIAGVITAAVIIYIFPDSGFNRSCDPFPHWRYGEQVIRMTEAETLEFCGGVE